MDTASPDLPDTDRLRLELWEARDALIGAQAELATLRDRNLELESLIGQLRVELSRASGPRGLLVRLRSLAGRVARRLLTELRSR